MGLGLGLGLGLANHGVAKRAVACFGRCESKHGVVRGRVVVGARAAHRGVGQEHVRVHHERRAPGPAPPAAACGKHSRAESLGGQEIHCGPHGLQVGEPAARVRIGQILRPPRGRACWVAAQANTNRPVWQRDVALPAANDVDAAAVAAGQGSALEKAQRDRGRRGEVGGAEDDRDVRTGFGMPSRRRHRPSRNRGRQDGARMPVMSLSREGASSGRHAQTYDTRVQSKIHSLANLAAARATCGPCRLAARGNALSRK